MLILKAFVLPFLDVILGKFSYVSLRVFRFPLVPRTVLLLDYNLLMSDIGPIK